MNGESKQEILLESGTNELEIMEFTVAGEVFGINVSKVREIMKYAPVKQMQNAHPNIEGIFKPRDQVITVVDLAGYLGLPPSQNLERDIYMITHFNNQVFAFHVHTVEGIDRISWSNIQKPDSIIYGGEEGIATGIAEHEGRLISILDFEKIITEISPASSIKIGDLDRLGPREQRDMPILIAEDSVVLSRLIVECLNRAGYTNIIKTSNGQEAWQYLQDNKLSKDPSIRAACVVTDVEMPLMDGHHLIRLIKEDNELKKIPVILFSSLIDEDMLLKGRQLGADEQVSKPEISKLVAAIDRLVVATPK